MSKNALPMAPGFGGGMANIGQAMMSNLFTPTEGIVWDLMTGNLGVIDKNNPNTVIITSVGLRDSSINGFPI